MSNTSPGGGSGVPKLTEAYKAIIDFNKAIISIASTILAALISFLVFQGYPITLVNFASPIIILVAIFLSLMGFGHSILALQTGISRPRAKLFSNFGAYFLLIGLSLIILIHKKEETNLQKVMSQVEKTGRSMHKNLDPAHCLNILQQKDICILKYRYDSLVAEVTFSFSANDIIHFEETRKPQDDTCPRWVVQACCCCTCKQKPQTHSCTPSRPTALKSPK